MLATIAAAIAVVASTATLLPVSSRDLFWFAALAAGAVVHQEVSRQIERTRELAAEGASYFNLLSIWTFAGLLLLPPPLVAALIAITYTHTWFRVSKRIVVHRWVFTASTVVLASAAAGVLLALANPAGYPEIPASPVGMTVVVAAAVLRWLLNHSLVVGALVMSGQTPRKAVGSVGDNVTEASALGIGIVVATLMVFQPIAIAALIVPLVVLQRGLLVSQLQHVASTDSLTGLLNPMYWHELARKELARAHRTDTNLGILMIDLDRFKDVNDEYGQHAGDRVLRAVARALKSHVGQETLIGRLSGEEFVLALPGITRDDLGLLADQLCERVRGLTVDVESERGRATVAGLTVSAGGAVYPESAADLDALLLAADNALFSAKDAGRNGYCVVSTVS